MGRITTLPWILPDDEEKRKRVLNKVLLFSSSGGGGDVIPDNAIVDKNAIVIVDKNGQIVTSI